MADWWLGEMAGDPVYQTDVVPLTLETVGDDAPRPRLDLGCGEGSIMKLLGGDVVGCDIARVLLGRAAKAGPVVQARLPNLGWLRPGSIGTAIVVMVLEHLEDLRLFAAAHRVVAVDGRLAMVINHPAYTAPGAGPIQDLTDGETLWRWGPYFDEATVDVPAGTGAIRFHHRSLGSILSAAAGAGWCLEEMVERGLTPAAIASNPGLVGQEQIPRLVGLRWRKPAAG